MVADQGQEAPNHRLGMTWAAFQPHAAHREGANGQAGAEVAEPSPLLEKKLSGSDSYTIYGSQSHSKAEIKINQAN